MLLLTDFCPPENEDHSISMFFKLPLLQLVPGQPDTDRIRPTTKEERHISLNGCFEEA